MRRTPRWAVPMGLAAVLAAAGVSWAADTGAGAPRPPEWSSQAFASAVHISANPVPTPFVSEVGRADVPEASSAWNASGQATARASTYYPGVGVTGGAALACSAGLPCPKGFPPPFPTIAAAQYPTTPDASTPVGGQLGGSSGPVEVDALEASAHAGMDVSAASARDSGLSLPATPAGRAAAANFRQAANALVGNGPLVDDSAAGSALAIDGLVAHTRQSFDAAGTLVSEADATLSGIHVLGGAIAIDSVVTSAVGRVNAAGRAVSEVHTRISGVTVLGQPATIDERGITILSGSPEAAPIVQALNDALHQALSQAGDQLVLLSTTKSTSSGPQGQMSGGSAGGLLFTADVADAAVPGPVDEVTMAVQLGQAGMSAVAGGQAPGAVNVTLPSVETPASTAGSLGGLPSPPTSAAAPSEAPVASGVTGPVAATPLGRVPVALGRLTRPSHLSRWLEAAYLTMTVACLALALWSRRLWAGRRGA